ncbi:MULTISPECIES: peptidoglycan-binding domain-containing protein [unclassified Sinorhizobium]|uniref:peptidoglycan-binding domain-containing protein n=1 Tax=unclassified Sinorhizobium TaxID=2613772 RepID=UPI0024C27AF6|nr:MULTISPECIES: peptidoglycan-binding domain-containing protein [unclassified Sinorhizobium]MDK1375592.1 peptidoglycan-binding domain-containing protein [Sinorhizobium sp. 6-70]MDK1479485.1 peptidoglycan-binding domain-containing protein [Sinorhizobium sp. 6-117]
MAPRKRKQPERKRAAQARPGLALRGLAAGARGLAFAGSVMARHPVGAGGSAAFVVVFSFVAANAMWYQHGAHPSPLLRTRVPLVGPEVAERLAAANGEPVEPRNVTTFVIERERAEGPGNGDDAAAAALATSTLTADIQRELARLGLYDGAPDGRTGPKTSAAILRFEKQTGRMQSGEASDDLLQALRATHDTDLAVVTPGDRPYSDPKSGPAEVDPVAAAIRTAEEDKALLPRADIAVSSELVVSIQKGLSNLAYADIVVDGVAGDQTRAAIRHFEKHYRLPQTGEPNAKVLKKLKEIGAL